MGRARVDCVYMGKLFSHVKESVTKTSLRDILDLACFAKVEIGGQLKVATHQIIRLEADLLETKIQPAKAATLTATAKVGLDGRGHATQYGKYSHIQLLRWKEMYALCG